MINSSNSVNFDGTVLKDSDFIKAFSIKQDDNFSKWVVRPLAALTAIGMVTAAFFASAFLVLVALAISPLLALSVWAMKRKIERELTNANLVVSTQEATIVETDDTDKPAAGV